MASVKQGIDKRGRRYTTIDGKHVKSGGGDTPSPRTANAHVTAAPKNAIRKFLRRWFGAAHSGKEVGSSIKQLTKTKFNLWFSITAKTSVGRQGRLQVMREFLRRLHDNTPPQEFTTPKGDLDYDKFVDHLKQRHNIDITEESEPQSDGDTPETPQNQDAEILRIVHAAGLDAAELRDILKSYKKSNNSNP